MYVICFGDSITEAFEFAESDRWPRILQGKLDDWQPGMHRVFNRGVRGDTTGQGLDRLEQDVFGLMPGLLLVQFGFNDCYIREWAAVPRVGVDEYRKNLAEFHRVARSRGGECVFLVNHLPGVCLESQGNGQPYKDNFAPYDEALRNTASGLGASMIDLPALMSVQGLEPRDLVVAEDGLHLSAAGNHFYAELVFTGLKALL